MMKPRLPKIIYNNKAKSILGEINKILDSKITTAASVPEANRPPSAAELEFERVHLLYDGMDPMMKPRLPKIIYNNKAKSILGEINKILDSKITTVKNVPVTPAWHRRITNKIDSIRRDIGILTQNQSLNPSSSVTKKAKAILEREQSLENPTATEILDHLKQKLKAMAKKLRWYKESNTRRQHNSQFSRTASVPEANRPPSAAELEFERVHLLYDGMDPMMKPRLPKIIYNNKAKSILGEINKILDSKITTVKNVPVTPAWHRRITNKIDSIRRDIGILTQNQSLNPSSSVTKKAKAILEREQSLENPTATEILDHLKQKLKAMAKKLRWYKESNTRRQHNSQFSRSERSFYKNLESEDHEIETLQENKVPTPEAMKKFWESTWGNRVIHKNTRWLFDERTRVHICYPRSGHRN
ncbi:unnamed protein product [Acanthoscelides obtectus]|uniref:Uncharacterized protein n=1 Tax=Acanthoscelides obtectus TaxID=200917 RepID=A0A9P0PLB2_ACAOB|nr:unnamed protein product [Acanthoscelides obtectus]CAK1671531.1 hypothetical protein AOBTE_LOCUS28300 [Acanthoscelides obtectus]